ncbi:hypothetical protein JHK87_001416 [Glycine soja]|nr:hypothetical protein JHK87_001416 [Glycine soja]
MQTQEKLVQLPIQPSNLMIQDRATNSTNLLSNLNNGKTPLDRRILVFAWSISTIRPLRFGVAPYNPTIGETHHVSKGNLNVSHHPPVSALHATNDKENIEMTWCHSPISKFNEIAYALNYVPDSALSLSDRVESSSNQKVKVLSVLDTLPPIAAIRSSVMMERHGVRPEHGSVEHGGGLSRGKFRVEGNGKLSQKAVARILLGVGFPW